MGGSWCSGWGRGRGLTLRRIRFPSPGFVVYLGRCTYFSGLSIGGIQGWGRPGFRSHLRNTLVQLLLQQHKRKDSYDTS